MNQPKTELKNRLSQDVLATDKQTPFEIDNFDLHQCLPHRLRCLANQLNKVDSERLESLQLSKHGLKDREWRILLVLGSYGGLTNGAIADIVQTDAASITRGVNMLKKFNLVKTNTSKQDKRRLIICLNQRGIDLFARASPVVSQSNDLFMDCFKHREKQVFKELLTKIEKHMQQLSSSMEQE